MTATLLNFPIMTTQLDKYPNRIHEIRKARGLTQDALGDLVGISSVHVGHLELGRREINLSQLRALARALDVTTAELLSEDDNPLASSPRSRRLLTHWGDADEAGRQAIERVAESFVGYQAQVDVGNQAQDEKLRHAPPKTAKQGRKK